MESLNKQKTESRCRSMDVEVGMDSCIARATYLPKLLVDTEVVRHHYSIQDFQQGVLCNGLVWLLWGSAQ